MAETYGLAGFGGALMALRAILTRHCALQCLSIPTNQKKGQEMMRIGTKTADHYQMVFDSLGEFIEHNATHRKLHRPGSFADVDSLDDALNMARTGLPREGIDARAISERMTSERDLVTQNFQWQHDKTGGEVDVARYLSGEPDCMIDYYLDPRATNSRVVTIAVGISVNGGVDSDQITRHGQALVGLAEAIDSTGIQSEVWVDATSRGCGGTGPTVRVSIRLKAAGEIFDVGAFMYALTHPSMFRALIFNTRHDMPSPYGNGFTRGAGSAVGKPVHIETDYPEGAVYIPSMASDGYRAGTLVDDTLRQLGLLAE